MGQFKTPFTREYLTSLADVETADRSTVVDSIAPKRDIGIMADYAFSTVATVSLGVFNGENINVTANTDSAVLWVGRATVRPIAYATPGGNVASYQSDSTRYGVDLALEYMGAALKGEYIGQHRKGATGPTTGAGTLRPPSECCRGCSWWQSRKTFADPPSAPLSETTPRRAASTSSSGAGRYDYWRTT